jgi:hypothetical protein
MMKKVSVYVLVFFLLSVLLFEFPSSIQGQTEATKAQKAIDFISKTYNIPEELLTIENEQTYVDWLTGKEIWAGHSISS